jgi:hypothetical protein
MTYLRDLDSTTYLTRIEKIHSGRIGYDEDHRKKKLHFSAYYNFRATLTRLILLQSNHATLTFDGKTGDSLSSLPDFHCLTHLDFINYYNNINDLTMHDIHKICPKLHILEFYSHFNVSEKRLNTILAGLDKE